MLELKQTCSLEWYYGDMAFNVYHLYCEEGAATTYGWFQYGYDGSKSSAELYMVKYNNDPEDTYSVANCLINKANSKGMRGTGMLADNDRVYFGWGIGSCSMKTLSNLHPHKGGNGNVPSGKIITYDIEKG